MSTTIGDYTLTSDFTTSGGGQCRWAFARKGSADYFLKEFLAPTYPTPDSPGSSATKERKRVQCEAFEQRHQEMMALLSGKSANGGNLIVANEFFRHGSKYYKVTDKVDVSSLTVEDVHRLPTEKRVVLATTVAHSVQILHRLKLVHGDIKPANVLLKETRRGYFAAKLIDFDDAYFSGRPPESDVLVGDVVYYSPETHLYVQGKGRKEDLTPAADIFSLAIMFTEYLTGARPRSDEAGTVALGVLRGSFVSTGLEESWPDMHDLLLTMMQSRFDLRPSISEVFTTLKGLRTLGEGSAVHASLKGKPGEKPASRLRGRALRPASDGKVVARDAPPAADKSRLRGSILGAPSESLGSGKHAALRRPSSAAEREETEG